MINKRNLKKNLYICLLPSEETVRFHCTDSSDKKKVGTYFDAVKTYYIYIINHSEYEIEMDASKWNKETPFIKLPPGSMYLFYEYPYWMFDWHNWYSIDLRIAEKYEFTIYFDIEKTIPDEEEFVDIPVLNKKAYNFPFEIEWKKSDSSP